MKQKVTSRATGKTTGKAGRKPAPRTSDRSLMWLLAAAVAVVVVVVAVAWFASRGSSGASEAGGDAGFEHVHGLGINPADGSLYAATHNGVFRIGDKAVTRVGDGKQDTMGFTVAGDNHFLGSGHPAQGSGGPPHLGLIESTDGGATWRTLSLEGEADFHVLRFAHGTVYGYDSTSRQLMVSTDKKTWDSRGRVVLRDFAVSPADPDKLVASGERGVMWSTDGGRTWKDGDQGDVTLFDWSSDGQLWAIGLDGEVIRATEDDAIWSTVGAVSGVATAFTVQGDTLYVATQDGRIQRSTDEGASWQILYQ